VYDLTQVGNAGAPWILTRSSDFNETAEFNGAPFFLVDNGTDNGAHGFVCSNATAVTFNSTDIIFYQFSAPGQDSVAGAGIGMTGNVLSLDIDELAALAGTGVAQGDHFLFSDGGTEKKITASNLEDWIFGNVSGDATVAAGGALTLSSNSVSQAQLDDNAVGLDELAGITRGNILTGDAS